MGAINPDEIISILKEEIKNYDEISKDQEVGTVISVGDGIATVYGIDHAMYGEVVTFENGLKGMVQDVRANSMGCILFGKDTGIKEGTKVARTGKQAGIPVGDKFIGRIVNALGEPIDGKGEIQAEEYRPIENPAPGIIDRKSVTVPLETGILSIDSMFPIGRGQRELIIGDRQTGKTSIATDTIINQKGKDVICIYVAIGQKRSTVAQIVHDFELSGAMEYTIVVSATASEQAPMQYIAPYNDVVSLRAPLVLHAPEGVSAGAYSWFHDAVPSGDDLDHDIAAAARAVDQWVDGHIPATRDVVPIGFSQGGAVAVHLLRMHPERYRAVINLSGFLAPAGVPGTAPADDRLTDFEIPVYFGYGKNDAVIPKYELFAAAAWLEEHTWLTTKSYRGLDHAVSLDEFSDIRQWLVLHDIASGVL